MRGKQISVRSVVAHIWYTLLPCSHLPFLPFLLLLHNTHTHSQVETAEREAAAKSEPRRASDYEEPFSPVAKERRYVSGPIVPPAVTENEEPHDYNYIDEEEEKKGTKEPVGLASSHKGRGEEEEEEGGGGGGGICTVSMRLVRSQ